VASQKKNKRKKKKPGAKLKVAAVRSVSRRIIKLKPPKTEPKKSAYNRKVKHKVLAEQE